jgi:hypothetical protein
MSRRAKLILTAAALICGLAATPAMAGGVRDSKQRTDESSPYIVGAWKLETDKSGAPVVDSEIRFINPTPLTLILEYAFFDLDGHFCGCDRDTFDPNKSTVYTMFQELNIGSPLPGGPAVFSCPGTNGAIKTIVFQVDGNDIVLDDASLVGFQTHVVDVDPDSDPSVAAGINLKGKFMTQAEQPAISVNKTTKKEIEAIHAHCVDVNGPVSPPVGNPDPHSLRRGH